MSGTPPVIVFDVNETLSDMSSMGEHFAAAGAPAHLAKLWFASLLRDGFAITAAGGVRALRTVGYRLVTLSVHPWDIHGAAEAGLGTAWINRTGTGYPGYFTAPDHTVASLEELAHRLVPGPRME